MPVIAAISRLLRAGYRTEWFPGNEKGVEYLAVQTRAYEHVMTLIPVKGTVLVESVETLEKLAAA